MSQSLQSGVEGSIKHVLLAEFDIDEGATLSLQYPSPTGADEHTLAELMLPDGAHLRSEDWTVFYLNQRKQDAGPLATSLTTSAVPRPDKEKATTDRTGEMLFVLNCVKMKEDKTVRRGAMVKALAICTNKPYIQIYKPLLSLALDEYYSNPSATVLEKLFNSLNSIPLEGCPQLSSSEKLVLRYSDRKDLFKEKFPSEAAKVAESYWDKAATKDGPGNGVQLRPPVGSKTAAEESSSLGAKRSLKGTLDRFSNAGVRRMRTSSRSSLRDTAESAGSPGVSLIDPPPQPALPESGRSDLSQSFQGKFGSPDISPTNTHFFETLALYGDKRIPIKIPLGTLPEEVGEYSIIALVKKFSPPVPVPFAQPFHPHLHTNGASTHPIILLINALLTEKRILFLGHGQSASHVVGFVLALCSLSGHVLRGFTERAFPYSNLAGLDTLESTPGYIAGVINPRFEDLPRTWDVLCNTETGRITVSKHLGVGSNGVAVASSASSLTGLDGKGDENINAASLLMGGDGLDNSGKGDSPDNQFIEEVLAAIASHSSEAIIRARFAEYVHRFVRTASRYEEEKFGQTTIGFRSKKADTQELGSGHTFANDGAGRKELSLNSARIDGWRQTKSYEYWKEDFTRFIQVKQLRDIDVHYQISRLRYAQSMADQEAALLFTRLAQQVQTHDQVVEFLAYLAPFPDGLPYIALGLFHPNPVARKSTVQLLDTLQKFPVSAGMLSSLGAYQATGYLQAKLQG